MATYRGQAVRDLVVVVPGILGSRLARDGREIWGTTVRRLLVNVLTFGRVVRSSLAIPAGVDPDDPDDGVRPTGLIDGLTAIPGLLGMDFYDGLRRDLRRDLELTDGQLLDFPYDWRLSCRVNGPRLAGFLDRELTRYRQRSGYPDAKAMLICHSMGGLVARWCVALAGGAELVSKVVTIGTPYKGSILALDAVANGVRLPRRIGVDLTAFALSLPSLYELLPTYSCVRLDGSAPRRLRDRDVLARVAALGPAGPDDVAERVARGLGLHEELAEAGEPDGCELICFRGAEQPTPVMATIGAAGLERTETVDGVDHGGDGVVPADSGVPPHWASGAAAKSAAGRHSSLPSGARLREELRVTLRHTGRLMAPVAGVSAVIPSGVPAGTPFDVLARAVPSADGRVPPVNLAVTVEPEVATLAVPIRLPIRLPAAGGRDGHRATVPGLAPGLYRVRVGSANRRAWPTDDLVDWLVVHDEH